MPATGIVAPLVEKAPEFYLRNGFFWVKMALFASLRGARDLANGQFVRWRIARRQGRPLLNRGSLVHEVNRA
jgi:uncharacterized membrane protein